jgi:hypothetical protein
MPSGHLCRWAALGVLIANVAGCDSPTREEKMQAGRTTCSARRWRSQRCEADNGYHVMKQHFVHSFCKSFNSSLLAAP